MTRLDIAGLDKKRGGKTVLDDVGFTVEPGSFCVVVGPSGCGKSTLLRLIAGLEPADAGTIRFDGKDIRALPPQSRHIGFVFQTLALYPHMSVRKNWSYGLKIGGIDRREQARRIDRTAEMLGMENLLDRRPDQLSGGQRQRAAIGRAIIREPRVLLFDEPLSSLDAPARTELRLELRALHRQLGATTLFVTHDQAEALSLADQLVVLHDGRVEQTGSPRQLYDAPKTRFVATFLGQPPMNMIPAVADSEGVLRSLGGQVLARHQTTAGPVWLGVRPEHLIFGEDGADVEVVSVDYNGATSIIYARLEATMVAGFCRQTPRPGEIARVKFDPAHLTLFPWQNATQLAVRSNTAPQGG